MNDLFKDKVCLVTGGGSGVGRAAALKFAQEGAKVIIANRRIEKGEEVTKIIHDKGQEALFVPVDISSEKQVEKLINKIIETYGRLDCAFNCAGFEGERASLIQCEESNWDKIMNTNLKGTFFLLKYEIKAMLENKKGAIVNMSSISGFLGRINRCAYNASRAAIISLTKTAAMEYIRDGIRVNAIAPAAIRTEIFERMTNGNEEVKNYYAKGHPIGRIAEPEEIAEAALWLCSEKSSYVVGETLIIDGGTLATR
ncbi:MAG: glucose 1-dehydrogenase [Firmicutes bacterium]|nr:glucose 1-dehydrogenase [Bacillota bacterium]